MRSAVVGSGLVGVRGWVRFRCEVERRCWGGAGSQVCAMAPEASKMGGSDSPGLYGNPNNPVGGGSTAAHQGFLKDMRGRDPAGWLKKGAGPRGLPMLPPPCPGPASQRCTRCGTIRTSSTPWRPTMTSSSPERVCGCWWVSVWVGGWVGVSVWVCS